MVKKTAQRVPKKNKEEGGTSKTPVELLAALVNWAKSTVTEATLKNFADAGELPKKEEIFWHAVGDEIRPKPREGEVVVLLDHITRGLRPPGSNFFRRVLSYYNLTPLDLAPNSILNISNFVVYCEVYLQIEPNLSLFLETFYCNPQNRKNHDLGPYGGVAIQRRRSAFLHYPALVLASHPKGWHNTNFYCKDASPSRDMMATSWLTPRGRL